ncbi:MAG: hypothetical protein K2X86_11630 [Cytophagaceae bacterium]|nr:hypothetical protein [Cytophagaceae bacterium]
MDNLMKIVLHNKFTLLLTCLFLIFTQQVKAQSDTLKADKHPKDSSQITTQQGAIYNRPFINLASTGRLSLAIGGYIEGNTNYFVTDGIKEGFSMQLRRTTIFIYSTVARRIKFLSEIEFENGTKEINIEFAALDFEINPALNFRGGIIMSPIGAFNVNHDGPRWEFIDRPLVTTQIIPSTLSEAGFGFHGRFFGHNKVFTYDAYLVNGLQDGIILNAEGRTFLQEGKHPDRFEKDNNGEPSFVSRVAFNHRKFAEVGLSFYGGAYNSYRINGIKVDDRRTLGVYVVDFYSVIKKKLNIKGELVYVNVEIPQSVKPFLGNRQWGGYVDLIYPVLKRTVLKYENTVVNLNLRLEAVDYNVGEFSETGQKIFDEIKAVVGGISIRPSGNTVLRANYRYHWTRDILGNPSVRTAGIQVGFSSYF